MKKRIGQIFSLALVVVLVIAMAIPAHADVSDAAGYVVGEFWDMMTGKEYDRYFDYWKNFVGYLAGEECPSSPDKYHHGNVPVGGIGVFGSGGTDDNGKFVWHACDYCGEQFKVYASDLQQSYEAQVEELPAQGVTSAGKLIWQPTFKDIDFTHFAFRSAGIQTAIEKLPFSISSFAFSAESSMNAIKVVDTSGNNLLGVYIGLFAPISGSYGRLSSPRCSIRTVSTNGSVVERLYSFEAEEFYYRSAGANLHWIVSDRFSYEVSKSTISTSYWYFPVFEIIPDSVLDINSGTTYNINSRPTSITGDYGIIGDNGQIVKVEGDKIVNETNNNYYNPATGETTTITDWSYNYEDRSYTVTTESGDTVIITYGDENVTIKEGDTIYNVYYLVDGSGSENPDPGPGPEVCDHTWTETSRTEPTCSTPGKVTSICSKCGQTKTETVPALGHTWAIDRTVQTTYDEEGNLLQQGYTLYSCSVCGEQYKDMEGTGPPGPEGEKSIWEKIGDFFGTIGGGFIDIIDAIAGKLLDALIALAEMMMEKFKTIVETILSIFDEVPALFGGFLDFLAAIFPFLPPEITTILTFGVIAITFIGILKAVRR